MSNPEPGWYPNPESAEQIRWWDGEEWTSHIAPKLATAGSAIAPPPPAPSDLVPQQQAWQQERADSDHGGAEPQGASEWLSEVFGTISARLGHLFTLSLVFGVLPSCIQFGVMYFGMKDLVVTTDTHEDSWGVSGISSPIWMAFGASILLTLVCGLILWLAMSRQIQLYRAGNPEPWSASIIPALKRLLPVVGLHLLLGVLFVFGTIVCGLFVAVFGTIFPLSLLLTIPLFLGAALYLGVRLSLALTAASVGPRGSGSITTSLQLTKGRAGVVVVRLLIMMLVSFTVFLLSTMVTGLVGNNEPLMDGTDWLPELTAEMIFGTNPAGFALTTILSGLTNSLLSLVVLTSLLVLYGDLGGEMAKDLKVSDESTSNGS